MKLHKNTTRLKIKILHALDKPLVFNKISVKELFVSFSFKLALNVFFPIIVFVTFAY